MFFDDPRLARVFIARHAMHWADFLVEQAKTVYSDYGLEIPVNASSTLLTIGRLGPVRQSDVARFLAFTHQTIAQQVRILNDAGLVERRPDPEDARAFRLMLSPSGRVQYDRLLAFCEDASAVFDDLFKEAECDLSAAFVKSRQALEKNPLKDRFAQHRRETASREARYASETE